MLNVVNGGAIAVGGTISVGRDGGAVGTYNQSGGDMSSWRFVVGDYYNETSGGGVSSATVSGGTLTTSELQVAVSANGSSSGSSFTVAGGNVTVNGEVIVADCGNTGSVNLTAGNLTVAGDLHEGFNQTNASTLSFNGGSLDMTGNAINVDTVALNSGLLSNVSAINNGATIIKNSAGTMHLGGNNTFTCSIQIQAGALRADSAQAFGTGGNIAITGSNDTGRLELTGGLSLAKSFILNGRQAAGAATNAPAILNVSGNNTISGTIGTDTGGDQYNIQSDSGKLTITGNFQNNQSGTAGDVRFLKLMGNGDGKWSGTISDNSSPTNPSKTALTKMGGGVWTISGANTYTGPTTICEGTLRLESNIVALAHYDFDNNTNDLQGSHSGTINGSGTSYVPGKFDQAINFTGSQSVDIPYAGDFALNSFSVSAWVNVPNKPATGASYGIVSTRFGSDNTFDEKVRTTDIHGDIGNGTSWLSTAVDVTSPQGGNISANQWHMITYVVDNANQNACIYLDGALASTVDSAACRC